MSFDKWTLENCTDYILSCFGSNEDNIDCYHISDLISFYLRQIDWNKFYISFKSVNEMEMINKYYDDFDAAELFNKIGDILYELPNNTVTTANEFQSLAIKCYDISIKLNKYCDFTLEIAPKTINKHPNFAIKWLEKLVDENNVDAMRILGDHYSEIGDMNKYIIYNAKAYGCNKDVYDNYTDIKIEFYEYFDAIISQNKTIQKCKSELTEVTQFKLIYIQNMLNNVVFGYVKPFM